MQGTIFPIVKLEVVKVLCLYSNTFFIIIIIIIMFNTHKAQRLNLALLFD